jgi:hypothetical protein
MARFELAEPVGEDGMLVERGRLVGRVPDDASCWTVGLVAGVCIVRALEGQYTQYVVEGSCIRLMLELKDGEDERFASFSQAWSPFQLCSLRGSCCGDFLMKLRL